jgi:hypothetical protein
MVIDIIGEQSEGTVATARIETADGTIMVMAEVAIEGRCLMLRGLHVHDIDVGVNELRVAGLRRIVREFMEDLNVDEMVIEGFVRTAGAGPGRTPRPLRFARDVSPAKRTVHD